MASAEWYYAKGKRQLGPVTSAELKQMAGGGKLKSDDLVWREGMEEWTEAGKVQGLFDNAPSVTPPKTAAPKPQSPAGPVANRGGASTFERSAAAFVRSREGANHHPLDFVLEFTRRQFTRYFVDSTSTMFTICGHYGLYAAMVLLFGFNLVNGATAETGTEALLWVLLGLAGVVVLFLLQYAAVRFFGALVKLNWATSNRMSSAAFLDCFALSIMFVSFVLLLALASMSLDTGRYSLILPAVASFILLQYVAVVALNPETLNIMIESDAGAGEEAIGVLSFFAKMMLRVVPVSFGVGVAWGSLTLLYACYLFFAPPDDVNQIREFLGPKDTARAEDFLTAEEIATLAGSDEFHRSDFDLPEGAGPEEEAAESISMAIRLLPARKTAYDGTKILLICTALPIPAYLVFLFYHLTLDFIRAVLSLPRKVDRLAEDRETKNAQ